MRNGAANRGRVIAALGLGVLSLLTVDCRKAVTSPRPPLLVVGVDGGERRVLASLWRRGDLPALRRLADEGALHSLATDYGISPVIWTTIATGVEPEAHGITDFVVPTDRGDIPVSSGARRRPALWNMLSRAHRPVAALGWWATWPAESVQGLILSDRAGLGVGEEIHPPERASELDAWRAEAKAGGFRFGGNDVSELHDRLVTLAARQALHERFDLVLSYYRSVDLASHDFWHLFAPGDFPEGPPPGAATSELADPVRDAYVAFDAAVGSLLAVAPAGTSVMILSDHGFRAETAASLQLLLDFDELLVRLGWLLRASDGAVDVQRSRAWVVDSPDYRQTKKIHLADGGEATRDALARDLERVRFENGRPAFAVRNANRRELRQGTGLVATVDAAVATPRLTIDGRPADGVVTHFGRISGGHGKETAGILLTSGPLFARGNEVALSVRDISPTILHALGLPVGEDFSGRVALELFSPEVGRRPVRRITSWGVREGGEVARTADDRRLLEELGALGYLE